MKLITHNMLKCNIKGVENGYPLKIESNTTIIIETNFDLEFVSAMLQRIDFQCLKSAANDLLIDTLNDFSDINVSDDQKETFYRICHHLLFEVHVIEGYLVCPESGRKFPIQEGIPNMLLHEDEV